MPSPLQVSVTCTSKEGGHVWVINRPEFKRVLMHGKDRLMSGYLHILGNIEIFHCLLCDEKAAVAEAFVEIRFNQGETVVKQGMNWDLLQTYLAN
jgi:hypothetical protein